MLLHGEGAEVNKFNLGLLAVLDNLYAIIAQYDPKNVYNMDETGLFFHLLPRYSLLMPDEYISTTRGKKNPKIEFLLSCGPTLWELRKFLAHWSANRKHLLVSRIANGLFHISVKLKLGWMWKRVGSGSTKYFFQKWKNEPDVEFFCCWTIPPDALRLLNETMLGSSSFPQIAQVGNSPAIWA